MRRYYEKIWYRAVYTAWGGCPVCPDKANYSDFALFRMLRDEQTKACIRLRVRRLSWVTPEIANLWARGFLNCVSTTSRLSYLLQKP